MRSLLFAHPRSVAISAFSPASMRLRIVRLLRQSSEGPGRFLKAHALEQYFCTARPAAYCSPHSWQAFNRLSLPAARDFRAAHLAEQYTFDAWTVANCLAHSPHVLLCCILAICTSPRIRLADCPSHRIRLEIRIRPSLAIACTYYGRWSLVTEGSAYQKTNAYRHDAA
jgi:hypothetical protein